MTTNSRTTYPGTQAAGDVLTSENFDKLPGGWIGYAEDTTQKTVNSLASVTLLSLTVDVGADRLIRVSAHCRFSGPSGAATGGVSIAESSVSLAMSSAPVTATDAAAGDPFCVLTPTEGSHTYDLAIIAFGNQVATIANENYVLMVEDMGPAPA